MVLYTPNRLLVELDAPWVTCQRRQVFQKNTD